MKFLKRSQLDNRNVKDNRVAVEADGTVILGSDNIQLGLTTTSVVTVSNDLSVTGNATIDGNLSLTGQLNLGSGSNNSITVVSDFTSDLNPNASDTYNLGIPDKAWRELFINKIKSSRDKNILVEPDGTGKVDITSNVTIQKDLSVEGKVSIDGDLIVTGTPYGTAPVVQNLLYVTMDGLDTNDGSSQDAARACRTIGGAVKSRLYRPGTAIKVAPGHYNENNPILLKPYTSVIGSDLRTTTIEPINKTQDLFHVNSSTYVAQMQFINGRSGIIDPNIDRGAYAIAFPNTAAVFIGSVIAGSKIITGITTTEDIPIGAEIIASEFPIGTIVSTIDSLTQITVTFNATGTNSAAILETGKITIYKSPYIQNCTNQSGPWLKDGTMFVPNQTVQLPLAVGVTTFTDNQASVTVNITQGIPPEIGMSINTAPQHRGFFDARTLLLANKYFIQEQILAYIEQQHPTFEYQREKCRRDVGIILENVLYDACFGGNSKSVEAGLAYYVGAVSVIIGEEPITAEALAYILLLANYIVDNVTAPDLTLLTGAYPQVFNSVLVDGLFAMESITNNINIIKAIVLGGPTAAPTIFYSTGAEQGQVSAEILIQANRKFIQKEVSAFIEQSFPGLISFNETLCRRDVGLIIDAVLDDMILGTNYRALVAGRSYLRSYSTRVLESQKAKTLGGINKAKDLVLAYTVTQEAKDKISTGFKIVTDIIKNENDYTAADLYFTDPLNTVVSAANSGYILQRNKAFIKAEINSWITKQVTDAPIGSIWYEFTYNKDKCTRDVGYIIDALVYDLLYNGNSQCVDAGNAYWRNTTIYITGEVSQTIAAFTRLKDIVSNIVRNVGIIPTTGNNEIAQYTILPPGTYSEANKLQDLIDEIIIILQGSPVTITLPTYANGAGYSTLYADKVAVSLEVPTIKNDVIIFLDTNFNTKDLCERDVGLIVDCISQDVLLNGNDRSITAGKTYYNARGLVIAAEATETIAALAHITSIIVNITKNILVQPTPGNVVTQVTNMFFNKGGITQGIIERNIGIISNIIANGPASAPIVYVGTSLFAPTGVSADDVKQATKVAGVTFISGTTYSILLSQPTVGIGSNSTLYFGYTTVYPLKEDELNAYPEWSQRRYDRYGSMGGMIIDGEVVSEISPIRSMVMDAYTQVNQGGRGIRATRRGYAQLVSVFTIFSSISVETDSGGILSITNSNANFGEYCMISKGYGPLEFSGTVYNPAKPLYTTGFYPQGGVVEIFVPDSNNRPHISLIMEVEPTANYLNAQRLPGFLTGTVTTPVIVAESLTISGIEVGNMYIGQTVYVRNQFGSYNDPVTGEPYVLPGTIITDVGPSTLYLNKPVNKGADYTGTNPTFFTIFTCGNAYYTVLTSVKAPLPVAEGELVFPANQKPAELAAVAYIRTLMPNIISNISVTAPLQLAVPQVKNLVNALGAGSAVRVDDLVAIVLAIIANGEAAAPAILKRGVVTKSNADAALLIKANLDFIVAEVKKFMEINYPLQEYYVNKCLRDARLISFKVAEDLLAGGNYNATYSGLSYYSRDGTYHLVTLEDNIRDSSLFPDGVTVNFYQRSYMSASGYLFEYVGAGSNYGALPQVGRADPIQSQEVNMLDGGKVFFTSTDQNGDFRIGSGLVINQATGVLSGRTFQKSLFAEMTPFILALE